MLNSPNRPLSEQKSERWPNMLRWRVNMTSPGGGGSSDGSSRAVAAQPGGGCEKGCRDDRRRMADDGRRSLMAEEAKRFRSCCLARKRSEKAKGRAGASPRAPATPWRPSAPLRLARAGSSTTRLHQSRREVCGQRILGDGRTVFRRRVDFFANVRVVDCFPFGEIFLRTPCAEVWPRQRRA